LEEVARWFEIEFEEAVNLFKELHSRHALFLDLATLTVRIANPFSGIPTDFKIHADGKTYFANCAWDMLGIPAALHSDAVIEAVCTESNEAVKLEVKDGHVTLSRDSGEGSLPSTSETLRSLRVTRCSFTSLSPSPAGTMTWSSTERQCFSSSRKNGLTNGASETTSHAEKFSPSVKSGSFPNSGITIACPWIIMDEAPNRLQRFSGKLD
jgi:hypothetical protein